MNRAAGAGLAVDVRVAAIIAAAVAAGLASLLLLDPTNVKDSTTRGGDIAAGVPVAKDVNGLRSLARVVGHPIYWAGPQPGYQYEVTKTADGRIYVRYLPPEVQAGDTRIGFTFVATYPQRDAFGTVRAALRNAGAKPVKAGGPGIAVTNSRLPQIVYLAYPRSDYLIEVYDRAAKRARSLVTSGQVGPVR